MEAGSRSWASAWIAVALVLAGAAIAIELLALFGQLQGRWGTIGGSLIVPRWP